LTFSKSNTTPEEWQFLTTEQALEDVVFFTNSFNNDTSSTGDISDPLSLPLHPSTVPWIWLGGSYPGIRGAHLRVRNPEIIFAVWASSAPVQAEVDMASYYKAAERSLTRNCSADWVAVTKHVDTVLKGSNQTLINDVKFRLLKARLSGPGGNTTGAQGLTMEQASRTSNVDAASILMDPLDFYQVRRAIFAFTTNISLLTTSTMALPRACSLSAISLKPKTLHPPL